MDTDVAKRQLLPCTESHLALQKLFFQISGNCFSFSMLLLATKLSVVIQWLSLQSCAFELYGPPESHAILYPGLQKNSKTLAFLTSHSIPHVGLIYPVPLCNGDSNFYPPFFLWRCQCPHASLPPPLLRIQSPFSCHWLILPHVSWTAPFHASLQPLPQYYNFAHCSILRGPPLKQNYLLLYSLPFHARLGFVNLAEAGSHVSQDSLPHMAS